MKEPAFNHPRYYVWFTTYGTYQDVARDGDVPPKMIAGPTSFEEAVEMVKRLGFGYNIRGEP